MKKRQHITESQLKGIVAEAVRRLFESEYDDDADFWTGIDDPENEYFKDTDMEDDWEQYDLASMRNQDGENTEMFDNMDMNGDDMDNYFRKSDYRFTHDSANLSGRENSQWAKLGQFDDRDKRVDLTYSDSFNQDYMGEAHKHRKPISESRMDKLISKTIRRVLRSELTPPPKGQGLPGLICPTT